MPGPIGHLLADPTIGLVEALLVNIEDGVVRLKKVCAQFDRASEAAAGPRVRRLGGMHASLRADSVWSPRYAEFLS